MGFLNEGHPLFKEYVKVDMTMMPPVKAKLRNFTEEEKEEIKEKVKQIRHDRESMAQYMNSGNRFMASIRRPMLNSRGSM
jgi:phage-related protein